MKDKRQGNDIRISWSIFKKDGQIFSLEGKNISLYLKNMFGRKELNDFVVTGNIIQWTFYGKDQKNSGKYSLELVINEGEEGMITTDVCDFVRLVSCSCKLQGGEDAPNVETESIELTSTLEYVSGGGDYDDTALWKELAKKAEKSEIPTKMSQLEQDVEIGSDYDDTEVKNELARLEREKADKSELTELSVEIEHQGIFLEDLQNTKIDRENDDYYPKMAVGLADNLAGVDVVDSEINFRRSGGGAISDGVARIESIKGNSVVWNQRINTAKYVSKTQNGVTFTNNGDGSISVFTDENGATAKTVISKSVEEGFNGHTVVMMGCPQGGSASTYFIEDPWSGQKDVGLGKLWKHPDNKIAADISIEAGTILTTPIVFKPRIYDLTQMFGAGNKPTTIEEFYARIPMGVDMNAYNEGEVIHMDVQSVESQGVNLWNGSTTYAGSNTYTNSMLNSDAEELKKILIMVLRGFEVYYSAKVSGNASGVNIGTLVLTNSQGVITSFDMSPNRVLKKSDILVSEDAVREATAALIYGTKNGEWSVSNICFNISDSSINGKYFPYIKRLEDLAVIRKYFPNGMKKAGSAHDEIRYNKASGKWEAVQRIGSVDMADLTLYYNTSNEGYFYGPLNGAAKHSSWATVGNILSASYTITNANAIASSGVTPADKTLAIAPNGNLYVVNKTYTDAASFKVAMQGVILYYELAEPIVTELDEADQLKDLDYQVWNGGTEKAIAEGKSAPLAADITYGFNAIGKIKELESLVAALRAKVGI